MHRTLTVVILAALFLPATADAHRPSKRAAANESRYAAVQAAMQDYGHVLNRPVRVETNERATRHSRRTRVIVAIHNGAAAYCMRVTHTHRIRNLHWCAGTRPPLK